MDEKTKLTDWIRGVLELASMGAAHEADQSKYLNGLMDEAVSEVEVEDGEMVVTAPSGTRFALKVEQLPSGPSF